MTCVQCRVIAVVFAATLVLGGCRNGNENPASAAPPPAQVEHEQDLNVIQVDHAEEFAVIAAIRHEAVSQLVATGAINPDVSRTVPVISLASGRVVDIEARLGDTVKNGQILLRVRSDDVAGAFSDYRKAMADEVLSRTQLDRAKDLYVHGAIALNDLQVAQDTEDKAKVDVETSEEHLRLLGSDPSKPDSIVDIVAPVTGVITDQQVSNAAGVQALGTNPFTISDLSDVWVICDVYENDLANVRLGDTADIRLNAYPDRIFQGKIGNIGAILDPNIRTAKVRIEVHNPGLMRLGMLVTATFHGQKIEARAAVPATAVVHLHDRDWVYTPLDGGKFRRLEVVSGETLPNQMQEILSGLQPGQKVVTNALTLQNAADNE